MQLSRSEQADSVAGEGDVPERVRFSRSERADSVAGEGDVPGEAYRLSRSESRFESGVEGFGA